MYDNRNISNGLSFNIKLRDKEIWLQQGSMKNERLLDKALLPHESRSRDNIKFISYECHNTYCFLSSHSVFQWTESFDLSRFFSNVKIKGMNGTLFNNVTIYNYNLLIILIYDLIALIIVYWQTTKFKVNILLSSLHNKHALTYLLIKIFYFIIKHSY